MKKYKNCIGCGVRLQDENVLKIGFTANISNDLCMRCFRLKNYGEYESISSTFVHYEEILNSINKTSSLVLYVVDILNISDSLGDIRKYVHNKMILVLNKRDLLPLSIKDDKIIDYIKELGLDFQDIIVVSSENNYNLDLLYSKLIKQSKSVYVVGFTNAGKSSLINKIIYNYGDKSDNLTISPLPSTTLSKISIKVNDKLTLIDTPGIIDNTNIINFVDKKMYKKLNSKKEIKPRTYQVYRGQSLIINDLVRIDYVEGDRNSFTFYIPNELKIKKINSKSAKMLDFTQFSYDVKYNEDLVINGLGFIKMTLKGKVIIYINKDIKVFTRKNLI